MTDNLLPSKSAECGRRAPPLKGGHENSLRQEDHVKGKLALIRRNQTGSKNKPRLSPERIKRQEKV